MSIKNKKRKFTIPVLLMLIVVFAAIGATLSLLVHTPVQKVNIFTFSDVSIRVAEDQWDALDNVPYSKTLYPGRTVSKDPCIENTGSHELYVYLEVTVPKRSVRVVDEHEIIHDAENIALFSYTPNESEWFELSRTDDPEKITRLYAYKQTLAGGSRTVPLFTSVTFANIVEGELAMDTQLKIDMSAYAIQKDSLEVQGATDQEKAANAFEQYRLQKQQDDN